MAFDKNNMPLGMKIVVVIFAVILIISMCLPFFSTCSGPSTGASGSEDVAADEVETATATTVAAIDAAYQPQIASLTARLESDPGNLAALGNLGNTCMDWGQALQQASDATTDEAAEHISSVFMTAVSYYDQYLEQEPTSRAVRVDRACCEFYAGDEQTAIADLEAFVAEDDSYSLAWFNLGVFYYQSGSLEDALDAFGKAVEADAAESYNVATMASIYSSLVQSQIDAQAEAEAEAAAAADEDAADAADGEADAPAADTDATDTDATDTDTADTDATEATTETASDSDEDADAE